MIINNMQNFFFIKSFNSFNEFKACKNELHFQLFIINSNSLAQIPLLNFKFSTETNLDNLYISYKDQIAFFWINFISKIESMFPHGYFLLKPNFIRYYNNIIWLYNFIINLNVFFWFRPNNNFISFFLLKVMLFLYRNLIKFPILFVWDNFRFNKIWAKLIIYWFIMFNLTLLIYKFLFIILFNNFIYNLILNVLSWRWISVFVWIIPAIIPSTIKWLISIQIINKEIKQTNNVPFWSLDRLNIVSENENFPISKKLDNLVKPQYDLDLTTSTDLEDGLIIIGEVSELGFQEITHWIDWTTGLTTIGLFSLSYFGIRALAGRLWKNK